MNRASIQLPTPPTEEQIELKVESPVPGPNKSWFALYLPTNLDCEENFASIVKQVEFRRKCMNQGFDNLLELLEMTKATILADVAAAKAEKTEQAESGK